MPTYNELRNDGKLCGYDYMREVYKYKDECYLVNFDNPTFDPLIDNFSMPSYETLCELGERVDYFPLDGSEHYRLGGLTFKVVQSAPASLEIYLV